MNDAELVLAARSGDDFGFAAIYDRYVDRVHDFCFSTLRDPGLAAETTIQTFLVAFSSLGRLRHPARLEPWLFAIAHRIAAAPPDRQASTAASSRTEPQPRLPGQDDQSATRAELSDFVRQQAGILGPADLALLDLHLRHGLDGDDLADAAGVTTAQAHVMLTRLRAEVERTLGALVVARTNRRECAQLAQLLTASGGRLSPGLREQITRHVDDCEKCNSRRRMVLPIGLLAASPLAPAPASLRRTVLEPFAAGAGGGDPAGAGWVFNADGFPDQGSRRAVPPARPTPRPRERVQPELATPELQTMAAAALSAPTAVYRPRSATPPGSPDPAFTGAAAGPVARRWRATPGLPIAVLAAVMVLIAGTRILLVSGHHHSPRVSVAATSSRPSETSASTIGPATTIATSTTGASTTSTSLAPTTVAQPGHFVVGATKLDFGTTGLSLPLTVSNDGASGLTFSASSSAAQLSFVPATAAVGPGTSKTLQVSLNRSGAPPGPFSTTVSITSGTGTAIVAVTATFDAGPDISGEAASPAEIRATSCNQPLFTLSTASTITSSVTGPEPVGPGQVVLHWQGAPGTGSRAMVFNGSSATAALGPFAMVGSVDWWITAADTAGVAGMSAHHQVMVVCRSL